MERWDGGILQRDAHVSSRSRCALGNDAYVSAAEEGDVDGRVTLQDRSVLRVATGSIVTASESCGA